MARRKSAMIAICIALLLLTNAVATTSESPEEDEEEEEFSLVEDSAAVESIEAPVGETEQQQPTEKETESASAEATVVVEESSETPSVEYEEASTEAIAEEASFTVPKEPIQIVGPVGGTNKTVLEFLEDASRVIESEIGNERIAVIAVTGAFHSGKTHLLNSILSSESPPEPGRFVEADGIWIFPTELRTDDGATVVLMNIEGQYGKNVPESYDAKLFAIATLLASHLLFVSPSSIDQAAVEHLLFLSRRAKLFFHSTELAEMMEEDRDAEDLAEISFSEFEINTPKFTWAVSNFFQELGDVSANGYMEALLTGRRTSDNSSSADGLAEIFRKGMDCHTLFIPATSRDKLRNLSEVPFSELTPEFQREFLSMKREIFIGLRAKSYNGKMLTLSDLLNLLRVFVHSANGDHLPSVPPLWEIWLEMIVTDTKKESLVFFRRFVNTRMGLEPKTATEGSVRAPPKSQEEVRNGIIATATRVASKHFKSKLFHLKNVYMTHLNEFHTLVKNEETLFLAENFRKISNFLNATFIPTFEAGLKIKEELLADLPKPPTKLLSDAETSFQEKERMFAARCDGYFKSHATEIQSLKLELSKKFSSISSVISTANEKRISAILSEGLRHGQEAFSQAVDAYIRSPDALSDTALENVFRISFKKSEDALTGSFSASHPWLKTETVTKMYHTQLTESSTAQWQKFVSVNTERVRDLISNRKQSIIDFIRSERGGIKTPDDEEIITKKFDDILTKAMSKFESIEALQDFIGTPVFLSVADEIKKIFEKMKQNAIEDNLQMMRLKLRDVWDCLDISLSNRRFGVSVKAIYEEAEQCFKMDEQAREISPSFRRKTIANHIHTHPNLAKPAQTLNTFLVILLLIVLLYAAKKSNIPPKLFYAIATVFVAAVSFHVVKLF